MNRAVQNKRKNRGGKVDEPLNGFNSFSCFLVLTITLYTLFVIFITQMSAFCTVEQIVHFFYSTYLNAGIDCTW